MPKLSVLIQTKSFKKVTLVAGIIFIVLTFVISFDPQPFLRFGYLGVFVFNLFGPGTWLIPTLSRYLNLYLLAFVTALGMLLNDSVAFLIGQSSHAILHPHNKLSRVENSIRRFGPWALFIWSLLPIPYDFVGFVAGYLHFKYVTFAIPTFSGKFVRFVLIGWGVLSLWGKA